MEIMAPTGQ